MSVCEYFIQEQENVLNCMCVCTLMRACQDCVSVIGLCQEMS